MKTVGVEGYQLAPQQKRLWQLGNHFREMPGRVRCTILLKGHLDIPTLRIALQSTIKRYEILHTTFHSIAGTNIPCQFIDDASAAWLDYDVLPHLEEQIAQQDFEEFLPYLEMRTAVLAMSDPAIAKLYPLGSATHVLLLDMPGLWLDRQGIECLVSELAHCYQASDEEIRETVQYAALAQWLNELLAVPEGADGREYWCDRLAEERPRVPFARTAGTFDHFHPQRLRTVIAPSVLEKIAAFTDGSDEALQSFLLACFNMLIWHLTGKEDLVIGTAYNGRTEEELRDVPGLFTRYIPVSLHLESGSTCARIFAQALKATREAEGWQDYFDWDVAAQTAGKEETMDHFLIGFEFYNESKEYAAGNITCTVLDSLVYSDLFDIRLACIRTKRGLVTDFHYNTAVLSQADVERFSASFSKLVEEAVNKRETPIEFLEILGEDERHALLSDFATGRQDVLKQACLPQELEAQVKRTPHTTALICQGRELTYAQLNTQANKLAHRLKRLGVRPETIVILCTERSLDSIVGMFGILKAGGVCVSLDPTYPKDRWAFILKDSQSTIVVTQEKLAAMFSEYVLEVVAMDKIAALKGDEENPQSELKVENLAYVMYTSGSTGQPKGVGVSHQAALNHFIIMQREFNLSEQDRVLQFYSLSFDGSLEQFFPALFCGATVIMRGPTSWSVAELNQAILDQQLTIINLTPALWQQWSQEMQSDPSTIRAARLRLVIVGAEAMTLEALRCWRETPLGTRQLLNAYGPTEAIITAAVFEVPERFSEDDDLTTVPIGRPLANREIYILNKYGQLTSTGTPGELYIGGALLARGYLNQSDLTAEHFVPNPFSSTPGARFYKTGDLGRYLPDGFIEYLGRVDQQVKIRGFRVELGEIEAVLQKYPGVQTVVVIMREDNPGEKRLVAYVLLQQRHRVMAAELRSFLEDKLPAYMIPSAFMFLDTLPLTTNGKIDRRALPAPDAFRPDLVETFVAPRNPLEETLASIWCEVLAVKQVGIHDNFFELGGHSLIAIQVIARVRTAFQIDLPVYVLFQESTIASFAAKVADAKSVSNGLAIPAITRLRRVSGASSSSQQAR